MCASENVIYVADIRSSPPKIIHTQKMEHKYATSPPKSHSYQLSYLRPDAQYTVVRHKLLRSPSNPRCFLRSYRCQFMPSFPRSTIHLPCFILIHFALPPPPPPLLAKPSRIVSFFLFLFLNRITCLCVPISDGKEKQNWVYMGTERGNVQAAAFDANMFRVSPDIIYWNHVVARHVDGSSLSRSLSLWRGHGGQNPCVAGWLLKLRAHLIICRCRIV